jgi:hypothetical protein
MYIVEDIRVLFVLNCINSIGTFLLGATAVYGVVQYLRNLWIKNETLYGEEAEERFELLKEKLSKRNFYELEPKVYGGGDIKTPRVEIKRMYYAGKTTDGEWKKGRAVFKYYKDDRNDNGTKKITVRRWLLKRRFLF